MNDDIEDRLRAAYAHRADQVDPQPRLDELSPPARSSDQRQQPWWRRHLGPLVVAGLVGAGSLAWAGAELASVPVESPFNPGGELECSGIRSMTPAEAEAEMRRRGYDVEWQYEPRPGSAEWSHSRPPPDADVVVLEVLPDDSEGTALILVVGFRPDDPEHQRLRAARGKDPCPDGSPSIDPASGMPDG